MTVFRILCLCVLVTLSRPLAHACSCLYPSPAPCAGLAGKGPLFVGTVTDIIERPEAKGWAEQVEIRFRIDEIFSGIKGDSVEVYTGNGGGDCSIRVELGKQYLVDAGKDKNGKLKAGICSLTRSIEDAAALLPQLRAMRDHEKVASLYGVIQRDSRRFDLSAAVSDDSGVMPNVVLRLRSSAREFETVSDSNGAYAFFDLPAGSYTFVPALPDGWSTGDLIASADKPEALVLPAKSCFEQDVYVYPSSSISGKVMDENGRGVAYANVELAPIDRAKQGSLPTSGRVLGPWEIAKEDGSFELAHVAPGDYVLVYNRENRMDPDEPYGTTFFGGGHDPALAKPIHLGLGQHVTNANIYVSGRLPVRELTVRVFWPNGNPATDALLSGRAATPGNEMSQQDNGPGAWRVKLLGGVRYEISAELVCHVWGDNWFGPGKIFHTDTVAVSSDTEKPSDIKLVLDGNACPPGNVGGPPPQEK